jgi:DNA mismatch repair protein MutL
MPPRIHKLPPDLADQIAAGEVVERPASVVKELLENAIDAGARRVAVTVELGGKRLVRVEDDGTGMGPEDAVLAVQRHATSKIAHAADLAAIRTLGFRGEALPSIASVSHFVLRTRARGEASGTEVRVNGGTLASVREIGAAEGTVVEVADLFYNLPARRKFLKADQAEAAQVSRVVSQMALAYPAVGVTLTSAGRRTVEAPPVSTFAERFFQLQGERPDLVAVHRESQSLRVSGLVAALTEEGPTRGPQNVYVNGRIVKDRTISHAITAAYAVATIKERSPEAYLFIEVPADRVDVNVHPTKAEVRFLDQGYVHEFLRRAIGDSLGAPRAPGLQLTSPSVRAVNAPEPRNHLLPQVLETLGGANRWAPPQSWPERRPGGAGVPALPAGRDVTDEAGDRRGGLGHDAGTGPADSWPAATGADSADAFATAGAAVRPMVPLGQFRDTYIIAVDDEGLVIVDQHVAHERVLFEDIGARLAAGRLPAQRLITPILIDLSPAQREAVLQHAADLDRLGIEVEEFGGASLRVSSVPAMLGAEDAASTIRALAEDLEGLDRGAPADEALRRIAATMACHAAVKANDPLTLEKMRHILDDLRRTAYSSVCPHGRPVVLRLSRREIEKNFQRI